MLVQCAPPGWVELPAHARGIHVLRRVLRRGRCLLLDPTPGACVVFPSFVPHLVLPTPAVEAAAAAPLRLSLAFNFGSCDPVMAHVLVLPGSDGAVRPSLGHPSKFDDPDDGIEVQERCSS